VTAARTPQELNAAGQALLRDARALLDEADGCLIAAELAQRRLDAVDGLELAEDEQREAQMRADVAAARAQRAAGDLREAQARKAAAEAQADAEDVSERISARGVLAAVGGVIEECETAAREAGSAALSREAELGQAKEAAGRLRATIRDCDEGIADPLGNLAAKQTGAYAARIRRTWDQIVMRPASGPDDMDHRYAAGWQQATVMASGYAERLQREAVAATKAAILSGTPAVRLPDGTTVTLGPGGQAVPVPPPGSRAEAITAEARDQLAR
jgi:hypothetical protein